MSDRSTAKRHLNLERLEARQLLSGITTAQAAAARGTPAAVRPFPRVQDAAVKPTTGYLIARITNPNRFNNNLQPPFQQVLVQREQPVKGQEYNILSVVVRNSTAKTFTAADGFEVKLSQQNDTTPVLTGDQTWKPGEWLVFYVLTKKYYPVSSQVGSGFVFNLGGARALAIPGPSGIFQRITYDPDRFPQMLNWITAHGPGSQGGRGIRFGLPVTNINELLSAKTDKGDFGGYF